jgi:hypothetical protein
LQLPDSFSLWSYGKQFSPDEMTALVDFLASLRPQRIPEAGTVALVDDTQQP